MLPQSNNNKNNPQYKSIPLSNDEDQQPLAEAQPSQPSLLAELCKVTSSVTPNDLIVATEFTIASYLVAHLAEYSNNNDGPTIALISVISHTCFRVMFSGFQLPAGFSHEGISFNDHGEPHLDLDIFTTSMAAMIKAGALTSIPAMTLLVLTPLLYQMTGTSKEIIDACYDYVFLACLSLPFQNCNVGFQQTLLKLGRKYRMLQAALINGIFTLTPMILFSVYGSPFHLKPIQSIAFSFILGSAATTLFYSAYFYFRNMLPGLSHLNSKQTKTFNNVFNLFISRGLNIFLQLLSELGAIYMLPVSAGFSQSQRNLSMILAILNATSNINVFAIVPAITGSQATANSVDNCMRQIQAGKTDSIHFDNIRKIINSAFWGMIIFSSVINIGILTVLAPTITSQFYNNDSITMSGSTSNPYIIVAVTGIGTTIDYVRNLALFVLRSFSVDTYGTFISYLCLWLINLTLVAALSQIQDIGVLGELIPYYTSILVGACLLWQRIDECTHDNETIQAIADRNPKTLAETQRIFPEWITKNLYTSIANEKKESDPVYNPLLSPV